MYYTKWPCSENNVVKNVRNINGKEENDMRNKYRYLVAVLIIAIFCTLFFFQKQNEEEQHIEYRAQNEFVTIEIHSFADAETFEKWKPDDMSITSNLKEVEKSGERLVIGSICIDEDKWQEDVEYQLEVEKENGDKFWVPIMIKTWERNNGKVNADFFVTEETDLKYEYLTILKGQEELVKFELKK